MLIFFKIACRNIVRNRFRSAITVAAVAIGFASLLFIRAFVDGSHHQMIENYTDLVSGHIQIHAPGFQRAMGLSKSIASPQNIYAQLEHIPSIVSSSSRVKEFVLLSSAESSSGVMLLGVDTEKEIKVTKINRRIRTGVFLSQDSDIVIGKDLAASLNAGLNDKIVVVAQGFDGSLVSAVYRVSGLLDTGAEEIDKGLALITLHAAQDLFVLGERVSEIVVRTVSVEDVDTAALSLRQKFNTGLYEILTWKELSPILLQWVEFDIAFISLILFVVLLVVAAGILNTLLMGILERTREFGIMLALGTKRREIVSMVGLESLLLGAAGIAIGYVLGVGLSVYFGVQGINLSAFSTALNDYYTGSVIYTRMSPGYVLEYGAIVLIVCLIVSIYPAWRAANLKPVEAIRG